MMGLKFAMLECNEIKKNDFTSMLYWSILISREDLVFYSNTINCKKLFRCIPTMRIWDP